MPTHLHHARKGNRWLAIVISAIVLAVVTTGIWWVTSTGSETSGANPAPISGATAVQTPAETPTAAETTGAAKAPASKNPISTPVINPATGRVDTLDGMVPDYVLPPIENGLAPVLTKVPTEQKVVFLTIDDGAVKRGSDLALLEQNGIKASLFLAHTFIAGEPDFYQQYTAAGHLIENHTMTHNLGFINLSYEAQKAEICSMADYEEQQYGRRPVFFRPPGGPYTQATRQAVAACGLKAIIDWESKANAGGMDYQVGAGLRPGEIVLMHFRPEFADDLAAFIQAQKAAGLKVVLLEDYLATP